jgi:ribosomal protein L11 methyltransferase
MLRRVAIRVPATEAEVARARLLPLAPAGFEEVENEDEVELAVYVEAEDEARIRAAFPAAASSPVEPGWETRWRTFHRPVRVAGLWIGPSWEEAPDGEPTVVVDPGRAFGTGAHPTTRACIELLARTARGSLLDAGCGSGVLAVAAVRLGFDPVVAVDDDADAVSATIETAGRNGVHVDVAKADVVRDTLPRVDVVVANIALPVVEQLLARTPAPVAIASGYLAHEAPASERWEHVDRLELDGWAADAFAAK